MYIKLQFWWIVMVRFCKILFSAKKEIRLVSLEIDKKGTPGTIVVRFAIKNAIWVQISGGIKSNNNEIAFIHNNASIAGQTLMVQGFFQKKSYPLSAFDSGIWKLTPFVPSLGKIKNIRSLGHEIRINTPALFVRQKAISHLKHSVQINYSTFSKINLL